jgi:hypothetical protein
MAEPQAAAATLPARGRQTLLGLMSGVINFGETGARGGCILVGGEFLFLDSPRQVSRHENCWRPA